MNPLFFVFFLLGGFSTGYSLLRTGFPLAQQISKKKKIVLGYFFGAVVFGIPAILSIFVENGGDYFFAMSFILYALIFLVFYAKRRVFKEEDPFIVREKNKQSSLTIPKRVLTAEEKERKGIVEEKKIRFEEGLMVSGKQYAIKPEEVKKQVFKEKDSSIIRSIDSKTKAMEAQRREKEKLDALAKLKESAKVIEKKKKTDAQKAEEMNSIEEDLLADMSDK